MEYFIENFLLEKFNLTIVLLLLNLILQLKVFKAPLDHDTSNHLYLGFLRYCKIPCLSSYQLGVKYIIPRLYQLMMPWLKNNFHRFRLINIISSSLVIILLVFANSAISSSEVLFYFITVLVINSLWVNYMKSASEFHEIVFILLAILLSSYFGNSLAWIIQLLLILVSGAFFKITSLTFLLPIIFISKIYNYNIVLLAVGIIIVFALGVFIYKQKNQGIKIYSKTRRIFSRKGIRYFILNPFFILLVLFLIYNNIVNSSWELIILQATALLIFIIQRNYVGSFLYPVFIISAYIGLQSFWIDNFPFEFWFILATFIFIFHTFFNILILSPKKINIRMRKWFMYNFGWAEYLKEREKQVEWLKNSINKDTTVYLWGSHVALLLLAGLKHAPGTYYNHNHLFYWSSIENKVKYAINYIKKQKPRFIIESMIMEDNVFPPELKDRYKRIKEIGNMKVYQLINL